MKKSNFPIIALIVSAVLLAFLMSIESAESNLAVPVLMLLFMSELGFFVAGAGVIIGTKLQMDNGFDLKLSLLTLVCCVIAIMLAIKGFNLWGAVSSP